MMMSEPRASDVVPETTGHQLLIGLPNENAEAFIIFSWGIIMNLISLMEMWFPQWPCQLIYSMGSLGSGCVLVNALR